MVRYRPASGGRSSTLVAIAVGGIPLCGTILEAQTPAASWRLAEHPVVTIGAQEGTGPEVFGRVAGAVRLSSGDIIVVDGLSLELRRFSSEGDVLGTTGRRGAGPGEFRTVKSVRRCAADSTFVYDPALMRISVFAPNGTYVRAMDVRGWSVSGLPPYDFWCNAEGFLAFVHRSAAPPAGVGPRRPTVAITVVRPNGTVASLGEFPGPERYFHGSEDFPRPLGKETWVALGARTIHVGTADAFEIQEFSVDGERLRTLREPRSPSPVRTSHIDAYIEQLVDRRSGRRDPRDIERVYRGFIYPDVLPAHGMLLAGDAGNLWIEEYSAPDAGAGRWWVYSRSGARVATVTVPEGFRILEAGREYVLGVWKDHLDVDHVRLYRLLK